MNITDPIRHRARLSPGSTAVIRANGSPVSYRDLDRTIDVAAGRLAGLGIVAGQVVGLTIGGPDEFPPLVIALALARTGIVIANPALPAEQMDLLLVGPGMQAQDGVRCVSFDADWATLPSRGTAPAASMCTDGSVLLGIFASSGTTGTRKFTAVSHHVMAERVLCKLLWLGPPQPAHICAVSFSTTWAISSILRTMWSGATLVLTNPAEAIGVIRRHGVGSIAIAPVSLAKIVDSVPDDAPPLPLRVIESSGSLLPPRLYELVQKKLGCKVVSFYGSTETGGVASGPVEALQGIDGAVGFVHSGVELEVVDADDRPLPAGSEGILRMRGECIVTSYLDPASSAEIFRGGWFYPGDIGALTSDGILIIKGRQGDFINAGGIKVNASVIEDVLMAVPHVTDAAAFGVPDRMGVTQIWAAVVARQPVPGSVLNAVCRDKLAGHAPKFVVQLKALPRNANGKVLRDELVRFALSQQR